MNDVTKRLEGVVRYVARRSRMAARWSRAELTALIAHHLEHGSCIDVWSGDAVVGVGLIWRVRRPPEAESWRVTSDGGDWAFVGLVAAEPGVFSLLIRRWQELEPGWRELAYCGLRHGKQRIWGQCGELIERLAERDAKSTRARVFVTLDGLMDRCMAAAAGIVARVKARHPFCEGVRCDLSPDAPPDRNIAQESRETLQAQVDLAPALYAAEAEFKPKYAALEMQMLRQMLEGNGEGEDGLLKLLGRVSPQLQEINTTAARGQREADLADVEALGPRATAALLAANPQQKALLDALNAQAIAEAEAGAGLDPSLRREADQAVRAGQAARGFGYGKDDLAKEVLGRGMVAESLRRQRQNFGMGMARLNQSVAGDPFLAILGRPATTSQQAQSLAGQGSGVASGGGPRLFDPFSAYAADLYNTNYNAEAAANIASANNMTALAGSAMEMAGGIAGGLI